MKCGSNNHRIRKLDAGSQEITTVAGNGVPAYAGDGGPATAASLDFPGKVEVDAAGSLFIVAGNGQIGFSGDGGPATAASLNDPQAVAVDAEGNLFIVDTGSHRIWVVRGPFNVVDQSGLPRRSER